MVRQGRRQSTPMLVATIRKITNGVFGGTTRKLDATHQFLEILATLSLSSAAGYHRSHPPSPGGSGLRPGEGEPTCTIAQTRRSFVKSPFQSKHPRTSYFALSRFGVSQMALTLRIFIFYPRNRWVWHGNCACELVFFLLPKENQHGRRLTKTEPQRCL